MKIDEKLILKLLLKLEGKEKVDLSNYDESTIIAHKALLIKEKFADGIIQSFEDSTFIAHLDIIKSKGIEYLNLYRGNIQNNQP